MKDGILRGPHLVAIQPKGKNLPFFCVHGLGGNVLNFRGLAVHMGVDQPFYGLQSMVLETIGNSRVTIEDMASHYANEIQSIQPEGPYFLGGASFGGVVAFEVAQQLIARGQKIGLLSLFDTYAPDYSFEIAGYYQRVRFHLINMLHGPEKLRYVRSKSKILRKRIKKTMYRIAHRVYKGIGRPIPAGLAKIGELHLQAVMDYKPKAYPGRITLFRVAEHPLAEDADPQLGWGSLVTGGIEIFEMPGDHTSLLEEPNVEILAKQLESCLQKVYPTDPSKRKFEMSSTNAFAPVFMSRKSTAVRQTNLEESRMVAFVWPVSQRFPSLGANDVHIWCADLELIPLRDRVPSSNHDK